MTESSGDGTDPGAVGSFERYMEDGPPAFAVTSGAEHKLVFANLAFRRLTAVSTSDVGRPIADVLRGPNASGLRALLDRVFRTTIVVRDSSIAGLGESAAHWRCTVWPQLNDRDRPERLVIEMWESSQADLTLAFQREVAERMLLSALRERDATEKAERSSQRATFLAAEGRRLAGSLDETTTQEAVAGLALPSLAAWCIVDVFDAIGAMHRLHIVHPDPAKQLLLRDLEDRWSPEVGDLFGLPAVERSREPTVIAADQVDAALAAGAHGPETLRFLRAMGIGALLTVPLTIRETLVGAVTFVSDGEAHDRGFADEDVALAQELAVRSAIALDTAKLHGRALTLKSLAESASRAKTTFLGTMSHELRTPLNAIGGYVDILLLGLRGPVSPAQEVDLNRIKSNQRHLVGLITDLLNFVRVGSGRLSYNIVDVPVDDAVASAVALVDTLIIQKGLVCELVESDASVAARADSEKLQQILINLLSNAIKFTPAGGQIAIDCMATETTVHIRIADTGVGIPADKLEAIFDPFVQVKEGFVGRDSGIGLGLAISRDLAHAMHGDLGVESELGRGSRFTLVLPRATELHPQA
jgi:signal transduction histidine kinase